VVYTGTFFSNQKENIGRHREGCFFSLCVILKVRLEHIWTVFLDTLSLFPQAFRVTPVDTFILIVGSPLDVLVIDTTTAQCTGTPLMLHLIPLAES
jgi:hypothetical protein